MHDAIRGTLLASVYDIAEETPLQPAPKVSAELQNHVYIKREDLQPVHSFKIRGAYNKISRLSPDERKKGVIAASAGNHAQGVALSAQKLGIAATIVMPKTTPSIKVDAVRGYGADVVLAGDNYSEAYDTCERLIQKTHRILIHPFDDPDVIAGQGTIGREILEQLPGSDYIFVPVGGGGLIAGIAQYAKNLKPDITIIGVEPDDSNAMQQSLQHNKRVVLPHVGVFADGVAVKQVGGLTYRLCRKYVDDIVTVNNDQICAAIKSVFEETRSIVEPAGALSLAGARAYLTSNRITGKHVVTIASGANMTFEKLQFVAERTLLGSGKEALFAVTLPEKAGALNHFCNKVVRDHNITEFAYRLHGRLTAYVLVGVSITSAQDKQALMQKMKQHGFQYQDMSSDDLAKEHVRHMIGGQSPNTTNEYMYEIIFPERPRALADFLDRAGKDFNISLFHYRGQGGDIGTVLIGFETTSRAELEQSLKRAGYEYQSAASPAVRTFLSSR